MQKIKIFIEENLSWLSNEEGDIKPFTLLGSNNVNAEKRITEINEELGGIDEKKGLLYRKWQIEENLQKRKLQFTKAHALYPPILAIDY